MQPYKTTGMLIAAAAFGGLCSLATGDTPDPVFWTQNQSQYAEANDHMIRVVWEWTYSGGGPLDPADVADEVISTINTRGLSAGEISIYLHGLGNGHGNPNGASCEKPALFKHWCDGLEHTQAQSKEELWCEDIGSWKCCYWYLTPWMIHGVENEANGGCDWGDCGTGHWMDGFVTAYAAYQSTQMSFPDPTRFHFDAECPWWMDNYFMYAFDCYDDEDEDRWDSEVIYGFGSDTMEDIWDDSGLDWPDPTEDWNHEDNQPWANWWTNTFWRIMEGAMEAACYVPIHAEWSGTKCSNWLTSCNIDSSHNYIPCGRWAGQNDWLDIHWENTADLQAPVLYPAGWDHLDSGDHTWDVTMELAQHNVDACIFSQTTYAPSEITPWLMPVGATVGTEYLPKGTGSDECEDCDDTYQEGMQSYDCSPPSSSGLECDDEINDDYVVWYYTITEANLREMLLMLRSRDLCEFVFWGSDADDVQNGWTKTANVIDQVWMYTITDADATTGSTTDDEDDMEFASDGLSFDVDSASVFPYQKTVVEITFDDNPDYGAGDDPPARSDVHIMIEAVLDDGSDFNEVTFDVDIYDWGSGWDPVLSSHTLGKTEEVFYLFANGENGYYINGSDEVLVRVTASAFSASNATFTLNIDAVSIAGGEPVE